MKDHDIATLDTVVRRLADMDCWDKFGETVGEVLGLLDEMAEQRPARSRGVDLIAAERRRQIEVEGYSVEHDVEYVNGELLKAADAYALDVIVRRDHPDLTDDAVLLSSPPTDVWPWGPEAWNPTPDDPVRQLVKAGALIAAEIDRLNHSGATP